MNLMRTWRKPVILAALIVSSMASANLGDAQITAEGYDAQSPEEIEAAARAVARDFSGAVNPFALTEQEKQAILEKYQHLDPEKLVPSDLLKNAVLYFDQNKNSFPNQAYITIVDFKPRSDKYRLFLIDMTSGVVERYHTTHGLNSDKNKNGWAESFGNVNGSGKSSLGFVRTAEVYYGKFKRSLRLDGLSTTNSNIRARAIVFHGWDKVKEENIIQGMSWGCWTIDWKYKDAFVDKIKEGSLFYAGVSTIK